jgi:GDPmannose 4,6-dehydratase
MTALIFGANGQDGYYLDKLLKQKGIRTIGISRSGHWVNGDITDWTFVKEIITVERPDYIFNFAANSTTRHDVLFENHYTISTGSLHILEAARKAIPGCKIFLSGSGLQFENRGMPINENTPFEGRNAYAVERIHSVYAARYFRLLGLQVYIGYFFNHDSPRRSERHVSKMITEAVKRIKKGSKEQIEIGDLTTKKEWGFAGDIVKAVWCLVNQQMHYEAVLGTGKVFSIQDWVEECFRQVGLSWQPYIRKMEGFKPEYPLLVSDPSRIKALGWQPETSFTKLATLMLNE